MLFIALVAFSWELQHPRFNATLNATSSNVTKVDVAMANVTRQLTNTEVKQSKAKEKEYSLADGNCLYLRVKPNGTKILTPKTSA